jgi:CheY-like chemotaxis protein
MAPSRVVGKRILLVEDERWVRECIKRLLWVDEHAVTEAADGVEACELFEQAQFDVVITDYDMPKMAGDALVIRIRARAPSQPIVMITGCAERFRGQENRADALLSKPFGIEELRQVLGKLLSEKT